MTNVTISKSCYSRLKRNFNFEYSFAITARRFLKKKERNHSVTHFNSNNQHLPQISISSQTVLLHLLSNSPKKTHSKYHLLLSNTSISRRSSPKKGHPIFQYCFFIIILNNSPWSNQRQQNLSIVSWRNRKKRKICRQPLWKTCSSGKRVRAEFAQAFRSSYEIVRAERL